MMHAYRRPRVQTLTEAHFARRLRFAKIMLSCLIGNYGSEPHTDEIDLDNICFSDECVLRAGDGSNRQNDIVWRRKGLIDYYASDVLEKRAYQGAKICIFVLIHAKAGIIGPFFADDYCEANEKKTFNSKRYIEMLKNHVIPELARRIGPDAMQSCFFQQDGAAIHTSASALEYLRSVFGNRIISLRTSVEWPTCSSDLSPLDFWFWARLKSIMKQHEPGNVEELKIVSCFVCHEIGTDEVKRAIHDFPIRLLAVEAAKGRHFEPTYKKFKLAYLRTRSSTPVVEQDIFDDEDQVAFNRLFLGIPADFDDIE